jgi:heat shock protein HslJ
MKNIIVLSAIFSFAFFAALSGGCSSGKQTAENASLGSTAWVLESLGSVTEGASKITLKFSDDNKFSGNSTCNSYFGSFKSTESAVTFSNIGSTKMMCDEMNLETDYFNMLRKADKYTISENELVLYTSGTKIAVFKVKK